MLYTFKLKRIQIFHFSIPEVTLIRSQISNPLLTFCLASVFKHLPVLSLWLSGLQQLAHYLMYFDPMTIQSIPNFKHSNNNKIFQLSTHSILASRRVMPSSQMIHRAMAMVSHEEPTSDSTLHLNDISAHLCPLPDCLS